MNLRFILQAGKLVEFYELCKGLNFARNFQFPVLEQVRLVAFWCVVRFVCRSVVISYLLACADYCFLE